MIVAEDSTFDADASTTPRRWAEQSQRAFSLVEMLIVLTVVGLLAAFAAPSLMTLKSSSLSASGAEFSAFLSFCRSKAIAERTSVRVGIVTRSSKRDDVYRQYAGWEWDKRTESYARFSEWKFLPRDSVFENLVPVYVTTSSYAEMESSVVEGDYVLSNGYQNETLEKTLDGEMLGIQYLTFSPSGRAYIEGGEKRNLILVIRKSTQATQQEVNNWYQFTVDTLTGRTRVYRP